MSIAVDLGIFAIDTLTGVRSLSSQASSGNYDSLEKTVGTKYQVPVDKVFRIGVIFYSGSTVNAKITIGYADTSVEDDSTPPVNPVELLPLLPIAVSKVIYELKFLANIPSGKFPFVRASGGIVNCIANGIEE